MTNETEYEGLGDENLPDDAAEADALEQRLTSTVVDDRTEDSALPTEADPADVEDQRHEITQSEDDDYR
ncbi:hypothetical protein PWY87_14575 [Kribbella solani]|uniref:hypothetical protein n=1 Tax=Kribbella solani TaxID=236067 RepID=UPI0029AE9818|nr:hypothetical protein [Kribbella solani]MDX2969433.1 hypothetical protein [Kribbella solani]MDX3002910.1 hypothetical protein [Kribbella solani]